MISGSKQVHLLMSKVQDIVVMILIDVILAQSQILH